MNSLPMHRVVHISDTHMRAEDPGATRGWLAAARYIRETMPDLVVHTGDIVHDDPHDNRDHDFAARQLTRLGVDFLTVPGNHDIGDGPPATLAPDRGLLESFCKRYSADRWEKQLGDWRLVGINTLLFSSGLAEEEEQWSWLADALHAGSRNPVVVFMHKPPFLISPDEGGEVSSVIPLAARRRFWDLMRGSATTLIACGHRHEYRVLHRDGIQIVWAPTTSALLAEASPPLPPVAHPGMIEYVFAGATLLHRPVLVRD
ncbi:MAG: metallophosphoesterase family protein [Hyphomicrobiales bacterium]